MTHEPTLSTIRPGVARVAWSTHPHADQFRTVLGTVSRAVTQALADHGRVEAWVATDDAVSQRIATWSGLRREGVMRGCDLVDGTAYDRVVYARLSTDAPANEPDGFRALLNSFLPRKRAIGQMLVRDTHGRVLMCALTYKKDWDLPGGVIEVGESPRVGVTRELEEELGVSIPAGDLVLTDWLPPWGGWEDALCLVYDGGVHDPGILAEVVREEREIASVQFCTPEEIREHATDFTARRVAAALAALDGGQPFTESGHPRP